MKIKNIMKQKRTIAAAVLAILMFPSGLQAKDNTVPANYVEGVSKFRYTLLSYPTEK